MNILAFSGSPRKEKGATDRVLDHFLAGAKAAGAKIEKIFVSEKKINYCSGCLNCWSVHPGKCIHKDDMTDILMKLDKADLLVYASPIYVDGVCGQMKTLMDRHITASLPYIEYEEGHMRHPRHNQKDPRRKMVFISVCGFAEVDNFEPAVHHMQAASKNMRNDFIGALVRPMGPILETLEAMTPEIVKPVYQSLYQAGHDAVSKGAISDALIETVSQPLMANDEFMAFANAFFQGEIEKNKQKRA